MGPMRIRFLHEYLLWKSEICLSRAKAGGALGRPSCESSLLGIPEAKFFSRKAAASKNPSSKGKMDAFRKRWASPQMGVGEGGGKTTTPPPPPPPPPRPPRRHTP